MMRVLGRVARAALPRLYIITDRALAAEGCGSVEEAVEDAVDAGARMFQLRDKDVSALEAWTLGQHIAGLIAAARGLILVNNRADLALVLAANGVHRPVSGLPLENLRRLVGEDAIIGASAHNLEEARHACDYGADFVTLSPIFETASKPGYGPQVGLEELGRIAEEISIPVYALGGVTPENCRACLEAGAYGVAVMGGVMAAADPYEATRAYLAALDLAALET